MVRGKLERGQVYELTTYEKTSGTRNISLNTEGGGRSGMLME
jgi:hypothetical protein